MSAATVDFRCPVNTRRLFGRLLREGRIVEGNLLEFDCHDCRKNQRTLGEDDVALVLHRFNPLGVCVETEVVRRR